MLLSYLTETEMVSEPKAMICVNL